MIFKKVLIGLSGGVDSAVAAYLLKQKGFLVQAAYMKNWNEIDEKGYCSSDKELEDAKFVANKLQIELREVNFVKEYWLNIFTRFMKEYEEGLTPNPDILCNRIIKFDLFLKYAFDTLKCDAIATGHYARTSFGDFIENYDENQKVKLLEAADTFKDQTFFLSQITNDALRRVMFPVGSMSKREVKEIAKKIGLQNIAKKDESTGLCFVGKRPFKAFIREFIEDKAGKFIDIDSGKIFGEHQGIHHWTLGQRTGLNDVKGSFVYKKDVSTNTIYVASGTHHPLLFSDILFTEDPYWIRENPLKNSNVFDCEFRFQHTKPKVNCKICKSNSDGSKLLIKLSTPLRALTPGQYAVFYKDGECLGSSRIYNSGTATYK